MKTVSQLRQRNIPALDRIRATRRKTDSARHTGAELQTRAIMYEFRNGAPYRSTGVI